MTRKYTTISIETTLSNAITSSATSITVASVVNLLGDATLAAGDVDQFACAIDPETVNEEIVFVTDANTVTNTLKVVRARAGTTQITHAAGATIKHVLTGDDLTYFAGAVPAAIVDAKGDLLTATAADTPARLAVGTNNQVLAADSTTATGLKWSSTTTTKGDVFTYSTTPTRLGVGADGLVLTADSTAATGLKWADPVPLTTKGDLLTYSTADTRLAVGSNNQRLIADSNETTGLKWVGFRGVSCTKSTNQSLTQNTWTLLTFDTEQFDTDSFHNNSTNTGRITIPSGLDGKYRFSGVVAFASNVSDGRDVAIYKNGSVYCHLVGVDGNTVAVLNFNFLMDLVATDYIEIYARQNSGTTLNVTSGTNGTTFQAEYLGA